MLCQLSHADRYGQRQDSNLHLFVSEVSRIYATGKPKFLSLRSKPLHSDFDSIASSCAFGMRLGARVGLAAKVFISSQRWKQTPNGEQSTRV